MCLIGVRYMQGRRQKAPVCTFPRNVRLTPCLAVTSLLATDRHGTDTRYSASGSLSLDLVNRTNT